MVLMGVLLWFINQIITGGPILEPSTNGTFTIAA